MKIGIPKEIKNNENRVSLTPAGVHVLVDAGHDVFVETEAGIGSTFPDSDYEEQGATIVATAEEAWQQDMVMKVKEPLESEYKYFHEGLILFTYLHLAAENKLTDALLEAGVTAIGYETMELNGDLPLLNPMSQVAGRMAVQIGAQFLEKQEGGKGVLLGAIPGVPSSKVVIIGGGMAGTNAAKMALGLGAQVSILELNPQRLNELDDLFAGQVETLMSNPFNIAQAVKDADLVIGSVLIPGSKAPTLVTEDMVKSMQTGAVIVDIAIDQGGIFATTDRIGSLDDPTFTKHGVVHYAVPNMPGAVPQTSTLGLTNVSLNYAVDIANKGAEQAAKDDYTVASGFQTYQGKLTIEAVAQAQDKEFTALEDLI
ncbi:alanine dehydrogenase [Aerococcus kribbianus]|uniref:Alanine dehydrogenase n=1 Tax=Aerococcus kribbianus TaxID=2999064 RepID=A0A9X3JH70_9LACT|nr:MULTISPECIES: alanine dehydrogenase [unclassified Aerococcus]MCZ0717997.1 alanine dehydrogenase [Aerococcus sp. YH-aer221]MCZ0726284.1 alanine dehydrogenase [Aerococcus sp. YH-aer222]